MRASIMVGLAVLLASCAGSGGTGNRVATGGTGDQGGGGEGGAVGTGGRPQGTGGRGTGGSEMTGTGGSIPQDAGATGGEGGSKGGPEGGAGAGGGGGQGASSDAGPPPSVACTRTVPVNGPAALDGALAAAKPGDCLLLADGDYPALTITAQGTEAAPIVVRAASRLKASFTGLVTFSKAAWVTVEGFVLPGLRITDSLHCRSAAARSSRAWA
jgi:hypothetical protein